MDFRTLGLDHVALSVADLAASTAWYEDVLGLENPYPGLWDSVPTILVAHANGSGVALFPAAAGGGGGEPAALRILHVAFRLDRAGYEAAKASFASRGIPFDEQDHDVAYSLYVSDPDGHRIELTTYEIDPPVE